jgi:hypothetical protein
MIALSDDIVIMQVQSQIESSVNMCIYKKNIESWTLVLGALLKKTRITNKYTAENIFIPLT